MSSMEAFPSPPPQGLVTICERNSELISCPSTDLASLNRCYPDLNVCGELRRTRRSHETARSAFLGHDDSTKTRLLEAWYEHGLTGVLEQLTSNSQPSDNFPMKLLRSLLRHTLWMVRITGSLHSSMFPHLAMSNDRMIERFSVNPTWSDCVVRCFAWHPHAPKFAIALSDDSVLAHHAQPSDTVPVLKHKMQKCVADLAWKPMSSSLLAVACQSCIILWTVDPLSLATRPSASCTQILSRTGHSPVVSIAWSPLEDILISASPTDNAIMVWCVSMDTCTPIKRVGRGGVTLLRYSPEGSKLFTAFPSSVFRVWQCMDWSADRWTQLNGRCQAACWSPDGSELLFAPAGEPVIYCVMFHDSKTKPIVHLATISQNQAAKPIIDLTPVERQVEGVNVRLGGIVQSMVWDENGERLAVLCQDSRSHVIIFQTRLRPTLEVLPCGFVCGLPDEEALLISFKPKFNEGSLLTVVWSSGRIAHIPLYYVARSRIAHSHDVSFQQQHLRMSPFSAST